MTTRIVEQTRSADNVLTEVEALLADVKKNPTRYFKFSVF
jgi:hypothetical protein